MLRPANRARDEKQHRCFVSHESCERCHHLCLELCGLRHAHTAGFLPLADLAAALIAVG